MKEKRVFDLTKIEVREEGGKRQLSGYASVFNKLSVNLGGFREMVMPGAFSETIKGDDIRSLFNHDASMVLGRNKSGTLRLAEDETGLKIENDLPDTQVGRDVRELVIRGDVSQMSFSFETISDEWFMENGEDRRKLKKVRLFDVSPVTFPAYPDTQVSVRMLKAAGIDVNRIGDALRRAAGGEEMRTDDMAALDAAFEIITGFRSKQQNSKQISREDKFSLLRRQLALEAL